MADHEFFGTMSVSEAPTDNDHIGRLLEINAARAFAIARGNHTGTQSADTIVAGTTNGVFLLTEKSKLAGIAAGATANSTDAQLRDRASHTGTQSADTILDGTNNKVFLAAERTKLAGIATGATANATDAQLRDRATHTGTQSADTVVAGSTNGVFLLTEKSKLAGIAAGATANAADSFLRDRTNHTGTQTASTISDFTSAVNNLISAVVGAAPAALDTLKELSDALGGDANFSATITGMISSTNSRVAALEASNGRAVKANLGNATNTSFTVTHNLNTLDIIPSVQRISDGQIVFPVVKMATVNTATVDFGSVVPGSATFRAIFDPK